MTRIRNRYFKTKRLRKKYHQGEFKELGFELDCAYTDEYKAKVNYPEPGWDDIYHSNLDKVIDHIESLDCGCGGGGNGDTIGFFVAKNKGSCTVEDAQKLKALLEGMGIFKEVTVGPLKDCWYA